MARPEEEDFLFRVYASTRADEMALVPWTGEQKQSFLRMQFVAQWTDYHRNYPKAQYQVIERDGTPIGRMILDESNRTMHLLDIALLPEFRNQGIGTALLGALIAQALETHCSIRLYVEVFNPARKLYTRLGFVKQANTGIYEEMIWSPDHSQPASVPAAD